MTGDEQNGKQETRSPKMIATIMICVSLEAGKANRSKNAVQQVAWSSQVRRLPESYKDDLEYNMSHVPGLRWLAVIRKHAPERDSVIH